MMASLPPSTTRSSSPPPHDMGIVDIDVVLKRCLRYTLYMYKEGLDHRR